MICSGLRSHTRIIRSLMKDPSFSWEVFRANRLFRVWSRLAPCLAPDWGFSFLVRVPVWSQFRASLISVWQKIGNKFPQFWQFWIRIVDMFPLGFPSRGQSSFTFCFPPFTFPSASIEFLIGFCPDSQSLKMLRCFLWIFRATFRNSYSDQALFPERVSCPRLGNFL